nr:conotoxin precursor Cerm06 [Conus ebraeus]UMA82616.1 conotoxin precursor Cerm06 [Conus ebraeus]UMA82933.1 conotoxin precursor Cerm06 [Conus ebraeus]DAZ86299.1 TPA_inf: conotoxin precursor Cerm06 [Conus ebraeus]
MKVVVVLLAVLVVASTAPQKRFFIKDIQNWIQQLQAVFNKAKDKFNELTSGLGVHFDRIVDLLIDQIDSGMTEGACIKVCESSAGKILGNASSMAGMVCAPVCTAALAKLEEVAG